MQHVGLVPSLLFVSEHLIYVKVKMQFCATKLFIKGLLLEKLRVITSLVYHFGIINFIPA